MIDLSRTNKNFFSSWWWTIDRLCLAAVLFIIVVGSIMITTASPAVAERIGLDTFYFVKRQLAFMSIVFLGIISFSMLSPVAIRRISVIGFLLCIVLMLLVLAFGMETKGAKRWIYILGFSLQPSEFMKPFFIIFTAWMLSESKKRMNFGGLRISVLVYLFVVLLLVMQPDIGMTLVVSAVWAGQLFVSGISMVWVVVIAAIGITGIFCAYMFLPHVAYRIDSFLNSQETASYQVRKSLDAFYNGGLFGTGPGEGVVKQYLPDSHTDFIFAVIGEELGVLICLVVLFLYAFVVYRGFKRVYKESDLFIIYSVIGLLLQFIIQAMINMGVALNLLPTKGMTLPFISYGGSSAIAMSVTIGMVMGLTRKRFGKIIIKPKIIT